jgi:sec-independent protein translocase protein TatA
MGIPKGWELIVILILLMLLFGAKRLPDAARGLGRSLRIFKAEVKEMHDDDDKPTDEPKRREPPAAPPALESRPITVEQPTVPAPEPTERRQPEDRAR